MNDITEELGDILNHLREVSTAGFRLTIEKQNEDEMEHVEVFVWESGKPNEDDFAIPTVVEGHINVASVTRAVRLLPGSSVVASFELCGEHRGGLRSSRPLAELIEGAPGTKMREFWTKDIHWSFLDRVIPTEVHESWLSLHSITLDLVADTLEDQMQCRHILMTGELRRFLDQLRMVRHLSLTFFSDPLDSDTSWPHGPFEYALDTVTKWPLLKSLCLDGLDSTAQELLHFLECHRATLKSLTLRNYFLLSGSWMYVLPEIRELLSLEGAEVAGTIGAGAEFWLVKVPEFDDNCFLAEDIEHYLTHPKEELDCPLTRRNFGEEE